jgi:small GTP-binding protein
MDRHSFPQAKVVFAGEAKVGKTSIISRFATGHFIDSVAPTVGASFQSSVVSTSSGSIVLQIWDTAGQEQYKSLTPLYFRGARIAVIVFDLTSKDTFENINDWITNFEQFAQSSLPIFIVGNKLDDRDRREVAVDLGSEPLSAHPNWQYRETSAKTGEGIDTLFEAIAEALLNPQEGCADSSEEVLLEGAEGPNNQSICC